MGAEARVRASMGEYSAALFTRYVGQAFRFLASSPPAGEPVSLELLEVTPGNAPAAHGLREPFSLLFALRSDRPLAPVLYQITHDDFEPCEWFVNRVSVPGRDPQVAYYQAVFG